MTGSAWHQHPGRRVAGTPCRPPAGQAYSDTRRSPACHGAPCATAIHVIPMQQSSVQAPQTGVHTHRPTTSLQTWITQSTTDDAVNGVYLGPADAPIELPTPPTDTGSHVIYVACEPSYEVITRVQAAAVDAGFGVLPIQCHADHAHPGMYVTLYSGVAPVASRTATACVTNSRAPSDN